MPNLEFEVPYNNDPETLEGLIKLKELNGNRIREIYLNAPQEFSTSGRVMPSTSMEQVINTVDRVHKSGIRINLLFNSTCEGADWYTADVINSKMGFLKMMHEEHGVEGVTVANPIYVKEIRRRFSDIEICSSVLADIDCVQKAVIHRKAGADVIIPDVNINRDLKLLRQIRDATGARLKLMVNEGCIHHCPWRKFQFNHISHQPKELLVTGDVMFNGCQQVTAEDPSQILKSCWVRPEDVGKYDGITNYFKVVGRDKPKSHVLRTVRAYLEESWDGDLLDIMCSSLNTLTMTRGAYLDNKKLDTLGFFRKVTGCEQRCEGCGYCEKVADEVIQYGKMTRQKLEDFGLADVADRLEKKFAEEAHNRY
jgi:collagenase-like PrtC family protease